MDDIYVNLQEAVHIRNAMSAYSDTVYLNMIRQIKEKTDDILKDDMGSQFIHCCGRDLAGEIVRTFFNSSDYYITVDQLAARILKFNYNDEYDPLKDNTELQKNIYNYNDLSSSLDEINKDLDRCQASLFTTDRKEDTADTAGRRKYRNSKINDDGSLYDDITGDIGDTRIIRKNNKNITVSDLHADHIQSREAAKYNKKYISQQGVQELRTFISSSENMQILHSSANTSKGDIRICEIDKKIVYKSTKEKDYDPKTDITHKATPSQLTDAICHQLEKNPNSKKAEKLKEKGYLNDDGVVPKSVRKKLEENIRYSQNRESLIILKNTKYNLIAKDAASQTTKAIGKIIAGQIMYYAVPPIVFEVKCIVKKKNISLDNALKKISDAGKRICHYIYSHLKDIFKNVVTNSLKKFIKALMDILIGMVKASVKKLFKIIKTLIMSVTDAIRIISSKGSTASQKADAVFNLFGITVTNIAVEVLFETIEKGAHIPEFLLSPLQIITSIICTNLVMLILQKADVFDVRFGFKIESIRNIFKDEQNKYQNKIHLAEQYSEYRIKEIIDNTKEECISIYNNLISLNSKKQSIRNDAEKIGEMFSMNINFDSAWLKYLGINEVIA